MTKKEAEIVYIAGQKMSNWLYNLSQSDLLVKYKDQMEEMVRVWDSTKKPLNLMTVTRRRKKV